MSDLKSAVCYFLNSIIVVEEASWLFAQDKY